MKKSLIFAGMGLALTLGAWQVEGPRVYPADSEPTITIKAENAKEKKLLAEGTVYYVREDLAWSDGQYARSFKPRWETIKAEKTDDTIKFTVKLRGGDLIIRYEGGRVYLTGSAVKCYEGTVEI